MAAGFTEREMESIRAKLKEAARESITRYSMQKITISELTRSAGISPGAFYKFYASKELLFFEIIEEMHTEITETANRVLLEKRDLPDLERLVQTFLETLWFIDSIGLLRFIREDVPVIMAKIPEEVIQKHYHSHDVHMQDLLRGSGLAIKAPESVMVSLIHILIGTLNYKEEAGGQYDKAIEILIRSACEYVLSGNMPGT